MVTVIPSPPPPDASRRDRPRGHKSKPGDDSPSALARALITLYAELDGVYNTAARRLRLTPQQAQLLCTCEQGPSSMRDLAELLNCDKTNVTGLVDRVAKRDLVKRSIHLADRRVTQVALTAQGEELVERFQRELQRCLDERLAHWPSARRRQLIDLAAAAASDLANRSPAH